MNSGNTKSRMGIPAQGRGHCSPRPCHASAVVDRRRQRLSVSPERELRDVQAGRIAPRRASVPCHRGGLDDHTWNDRLRRSGGSGHACRGQLRGLVNVVHGYSPLFGGKIRRPTAVPEGWCEPVSFSSTAGSLVSRRWLHRGWAASRWCRPSGHRERTRP